MTGLIRVIELIDYLYFRERPCSFNYKFVQVTDLTLILSYLELPSSLRR